MDNKTSFEDWLDKFDPLFEKASDCEFELSAEKYVELLSLHTNSPATKKNSVDDATCSRLFMSITNTI